jgi:hypothetical protein
MRRKGRRFQDQRVSAKVLSRSLAHRNSFYRQPRATPSRFLDRLNALQAATESDRPGATFHNNWGEDIKLKIPESGLILGRT